MNNFSKDKIEYYISLGMTGDNYSPENYFANRDNVISIKRDLLELAIQVDRWDLTAADFIFNSLAKEFVKDNLKSDLLLNEDGIDVIWGRRINYSDYLPLNKVMAIDLYHPPLGNKHIALFEFNLKLLERIQNLKPFW